jgi:hypothetical protein
MSLRFSNHKTLSFSDLVKRKEWKVFRECVQSMEVVFSEDYRSSPWLNARNEFEEVCKMLRNNKCDEMFKLFVKKAIDACAQAEDYETLKYISDREIYGPLSDEAKKVLDKYYRHREHAIELLRQHISRGKRIYECEFEEEYHSIKIICRNSRLSFVKNKMEYVVFCEDDE